MPQSIPTCKEWLAAKPQGRADIGLAGVPIGRACISVNHGWTTPPVFREQLWRYPTWDAEREIDLSQSLTIRDLGDVEGDEHDADAVQAHLRIEDFVKQHRNDAGVMVLIGGDNSLTRPAMFGLAERKLDDGWGLLTLDAHHDTRPVENGISRNGTPVRELIEAGLPGSRVAQIGIQPFGNNYETARFARESGIRVYSIQHVRTFGMAEVLAFALRELQEAGADKIYFDFDIDVHDIAYAPGCPASMSGGLTPSEGKTAALMLGSEPSVVAMDMTEVDASRPGGVDTARLMGDIFLHFCSGVAQRKAEHAQHE